MQLSNIRTAVLSFAAFATIVVFGVPRTTAGADSRQVKSLKEIVRAVNAGDAKSYASVYAPDGVITIYGGDTLQGRNAIESYEVALLQQFPGTVIAFQTIWENAPFAVVQYGVNGRTPAGRAMGHEGLLFYRFDTAGLIVEEHRYLDSLTPMGQLGALGKAEVRPPPALQTTVRVLSHKGSREEVAKQAIVAKTLQDLDARNEAAFLSHFASDAELDDLMCPRPFVGQRSAQTWFEMWTRAADTRTEVRYTLAAGNFVLVETTVRGTLKRSLGPITQPSLAKNFVANRGAIFEVKHGKIVHLAMFMNGKELAESVGQWPLAAMKSR